MNFIIYGNEQYNSNNYKIIFNSINEIVEKAFISIVERKIKTNYDKNKK